MSSTESITVLIADDHPIFRRGLADIIAADASMTLVGEAADGEQAWKIMREVQPRVALLDIHMPRQNGLQLSRSCLQQRLPIELIILTMDTDEALLHEALHLGVRGYLLKESAVTELLRAVHQVASGQSYVSPLLSGALLRHNAAWTELRTRKTGLSQLTPTELQVLKLIAEDKTSKEIADFFQCSVRTVETHRNNISHKLGLAGSHSLLRFAFDHKAQL